jgi:hypothetical protein
MPQKLNHMDRAVLERIQRTIQDDLPVELLANLMDAIEALKA